MSVIDGYLTVEQLAQQLNISTRTLARWHARRVGPPITKVGSTTYYREDSVREWLIKQEQPMRPEPKRRRA